MKHKIQTVHVKDLDHCEFLCYQHDNCVSLNIKKDPDSSTGRQGCELNNSTHMEHGEHLTTNNAYLYRGAKVMNIIRLSNFTIFNNCPPRISANIHRDMSSLRRMIVLLKLPKMNITNCREKKLTLRI